MLPEDEGAECSTGAAAPKKGRPLGVGLLTVGQARLGGAEPQGIAILMVHGNRRINIRVFAQL